MAEEAGQPGSEEYSSYSDSDSGPAPNRKAATQEEMASEPEPPQHSPRASRDDSRPESEGAALQNNKHGLINRGPGQIRLKTQILKIPVLRRNAPGSVKPCLTSNVQTIRYANTWPILNAPGYADSQT